MSGDSDRMERAERIRRMREGTGSATETAATQATETDTTETDTTETDATETVEDATETAEREERVDSETGDGETGDTTDAARAVADAAAAASEFEFADGTDDTTATPADTGATDEREDTETPDDATDEAEPPTGVDAETEHTRETRTRVLEFTLGAEQYCLDIDYIEEIVKRETITRVPNTPEYVEGVVDLRGQITTILNPKPVMGIDADGAEELIVVFDADEFDDGGAIGWLVDDVRQVTPVSDDEVSQPPIDEEYINGVIDREDDDQFVIWTTPDLALDEASS